MQNLEMFHTASSPSLQHQAIKPCSETVPDISSPLAHLNAFVNTQIQITLQRSLPFKALQSIPKLGRNFCLYCFYNTDICVHKDMEIFFLSKKFLNAASQM